jgi:DNA-directed RNA polymerase specialized sigma24 family protein
MTEAQFDAIAKLIRSRDPSRKAAKLVLVFGLSTTQAAKELGVPVTTVCNAARRLETADALIRKAYHLE